MPVGKAPKQNKSPKAVGSGVSFVHRVVAIVKAIPRGKVLTYGQVAVLAGAPRASRIVGGVLYNLGPGDKLPWQRVINRQGGLSTYRIGFGERQKKLLKKEGIIFSPQDRVDLKKYQWFPGKKLIKKWELPDHLAFDLQERFRL